MLIHLVLPLDLHLSLDTTSVSVRCTAKIVSMSATDNLKHTGSETFFKHIFSVNRWLWDLANYIDILDRCTLAENVCTALSCSQENPPVESRHWWSEEVWWHNRTDNWRDWCIGKRKKPDGFWEDLGRDWGVGWTFQRQPKTKQKGKYI